MLEIGGPYTKNILFSILLKHVRTLFFLKTERIRVYKSNQETPFFDVVAEYVLR
jgi:hypothetical protein